MAVAFSFRADRRFIAPRSASDGGRSMVGTTMELLHAAGSRPSTTHGAIASTIASSDGHQGARARGGRKSPGP